jgi:hypothetical protein
MKSLPAASSKKSPPPKKGGDGKFPRVEKAAKGKGLPSSSADRDDIMNSIFSRLAGDDSSTKQAPPTKKDSQPRFTPDTKGFDSLTFTVGGDDEEEDEMF